MNWRRGLLRLWLVLSTLWSALVVVADVWERIANPRWHPPASDLLVVVVLAAAPWLLTSAVLAIRWVARGFSSSELGAARTGKTAVQNLAPGQREPEGERSAAAAPAAKPPADRGEILASLAAAAPAIVPTLYVLDMPSWFLVSRARFPRWVFIILLLRIIARR